MATHEIRLVRTVLEFATVKVDYDDSLVDQLSHNLDTTNGSVAMQLAESYVKLNGWKIEPESNDAKFYSSPSAMWEIDGVTVENNSNLTTHNH